VIRPSISPTLAVAACLAVAAVFTTSVQASSAARTAGSCAPGATRSLVDDDRSFAVDVRGLVRVHRRPGGPAFARFGTLNVNGVRTVFAAIEAVIGERCRAAWYRVQIPLKPNGVTGYVRARSVNLRPVRSRVVVDLSARRLTAFHRGRSVLSARVAIGSTATPTPTGRFYVNQKFRTDPAGPYGWAAIGISAFSEVLTGWPQGGPVAIHGTNRPSLLGRRVSNGCIRVTNGTIRRLWRLAPTGTPVVVQD
jgi:hypothetical protein